MNLVGNKLAEYSMTGCEVNRSQSSILGELQEVAYSGQDWGLSSRCCKLQAASLCRASNKWQPHFFDNCIVISQVGTGYPVPRIRRAGWRAAGWIGGQVRQHLDIGEDSSLWVDDLQVSVSRGHSLARRLPTLIVLVRWKF